MRLLGLSSLDGLLSLLLFELSWWGVVFVGQYLPYLIYSVTEYLEEPVPPQHNSALEEPFKLEHHLLEGDIRNEFVYGSEVEQGFNNNISYLQKNKEYEWFELKFLIGYGILLFLRFQTPLLLLITVLKNRANEHCQLLKIWQWAGVILDIGILALTLIWKFSMGNLSIIGPTFLIFRIIFWVFSTGIVNELSVKESSLFSTPGCKGVFIYLGSNAQNSLLVLLCWEILTNSLNLLSSFMIMACSDACSSEFSFLLPHAYPGYSFVYGPYPSIISWCITIGLLFVASFQLLAVHKSWKRALKFLLVLYLIFGVVGYLVVECGIFYQVFSLYEYMPTELQKPFMDWVGAGAQIPMLIGTTLLKIFVIIFTLKFCNETEKEVVEQEEKRSLLDKPSEKQ